MADEKREDDNKKEDENDPYKFFKFAGPVNNDDDKDKKKDNRKKPRIPFFTILLILFCAFAVIDLFWSSKGDNLIAYSDFRDMVQNGKIVRVEIGENYITGYGPGASVTSSGEKGIRLFSSFLTEAAFRGFR